MEEEARSTNVEAAATRQRSNKLGRARMQLLDLLARIQASGQQTALTMKETQAQMAALEVKPGQNPITPDKRAPKHLSISFSSALRSFLRDY